MTHRILLAWAVSASVLALLLLGYVVGARCGAAPGATGVPANASQPTDPAAAAGSSDADPYRVPDALSGLPSEWHTPFTGDDFDGYAVLFDPSRREVIVEQCRHRGYIEPRSGATIQPGWEFCDSVLWATLMQIDERSAVVRTRSRQQVELGIAASSDGDVPRLKLSFPGHQMTLVPGSKNDLYQAMENSPSMLDQKERFQRAVIIREDAMKRLQQEGASVIQGDEIPAYSLPATGDRTDDDRQADTQHVPQ